MPGRCDTGDLNLKDLLAPLPKETEDRVTNIEAEIMLENQHPSQNHQPFQFYHKRKLRNRDAHSSLMTGRTGRTGRTGPAHGTLTVSFTKLGSLASFSWTLIILKMSILSCEPPVLLSVPLVVCADLGSVPRQRGLELLPAVVGAVPPDRDLQLDFTFSEHRMDHPAPEHKPEIHQQKVTRTSLTVLAWLEFSGFHCMFVSD